MPTSEHVSEAAPRPIGHDAIAGTLSNPVLRFDLTAELDHLRRQDAGRSGSGPSSTTLVKHPDLRVVLVAIRAGETMPQHRTVARITVHVLAGKLRLRLADAVEELAPGHLLAMDRDLPHDVEAVEDSAFLLTLAWPDPPPRNNKENGEKAALR